MSNLHGKIVNIPLDNPQHDVMKDRERIAYKLGHRDARHAAAELALEADQRQEALETALGEMMTMWRSVCDRQDWDPEHLVEYAASAKILEEK